MHVKKQSCVRDLNGIFRVSVILRIRTRGGINGLKFKSVKIRRELRGFQLNQTGFNINQSKFNLDSLLIM